jgi:HEXXH motif-containing protein
LVGEFESRARVAGWERSTYGTHRWITDDPAAPHQTAGAVAIGEDAFLVELLPEESKLALEDLPIADAVSERDVAQLRAAVAAISSVEGLAETVASVVWACHVLVADPGYDVSHSAPDLPLSVFVSIPNTAEPDAVLRLAESLIHEAMHLQLTFIESVVPLVKSTEATAFSPWKGEDRPVQGVVHALYVFAVIREALSTLGVVYPEAASYASRRGAEIADEVEAIGNARPSLTAVGAELWDRLRAQLKVTA